MENNLVLLTIIVDYTKNKEITNIFKRYNLYFNYKIQGFGSASSSLLDYFGLNEVKKQIYISLLPNKLISEIIYQLNKSLNLEKIGTGIAYTIRLSSSVKYLYDAYAISNIQEEDKKMIKKDKYHLIITITEEGYSEKVMSVAKNIGATGGTVIKGSGLGNKDAIKFLGFLVEPEKDITLIVVPNAIRLKMMNAITKETGINTKGKGICFSMPIDKAIGLGEEVKFEKI